MLCHILIIIAEAHQPSVRQCILLRVLRGCKHCPLVPPPNKSPSQQVPSSFHGIARALPSTCLLSWRYKAPLSHSYVPQMTKSQRLMKWHSCSLRPHLLELENFLSERNIDVACITETFLSPARKIFVLGFVTYSHDRADGRGCGAVILVRSTIKQTKWPITIVEVNSVSVDIKHTISLRVTACYNSLQSVFTA